MSDIVVETTSGRLRGTTDRGVAVFKGIPYARPPLGDLRFRPPESPDPWAGIRDALAFGNQAIQSENVFSLPEDLLRICPLSGVEATSEDCLTLNVWSSGLGG